MGVMNTYMLNIRFGLSIVCLFFLCTHSNSQFFQKDTISDSLDFDTLYSQSEESQDTVIVSVLLPFYIADNDTLVSKLINDNLDTNVIFNRSKLSLNLLTGVMLAVDSISSLGYPVKLHVFDTKRDVNRVRDIIWSDSLKSSNVIFGPLYSNTFNVLRSFLGTVYLNRNVKLLNPFSSNLQILESSNVYFLRPFNTIYIDTIISFLQKKKQDILIVTFQKEGSPNIIRNRLLKDSIHVNLVNFNNLIEINKNSLDDLLIHENMIIVLQDEDKSFINRIVSFCSTLDKNISILGSKSWINIPELDVQILNSLNVHIPLVDYIDPNLNSNEIMLRNYERRFHSIMMESSYISFKSVLFFVMDNLGLESSLYNFSTFNMSKGYVNTKINIYRYQDFNLIKD